MRFDAFSETPITLLFPSVDMTYMALLTIVKWLPGKSNVITESFMVTPKTRCRNPKPNQEVAQIIKPHYENKWTNTECLNPSEEVSIIQIYIDFQGS